MTEEQKTILRNIILAKTHEFNNAIDINARPPTELDEQATKIKQVVADSGICNQYSVFALKLFSALLNVDLSEKTQKFPLDFMSAFDLTLVKLGEGNSMLDYSEGLVFLIGYNHGGFHSFERADLTTVLGESMRSIPVESFVPVTDSDIETFFSSIDMDKLFSHVMDKSDYYKSLVFKKVLSIE